MRNFAHQCLELARLLLGNALSSVNEEGAVVPAEGETALPDESAHAFNVLAEFYRTTHETTLNGADLIETAAHCFLHQSQQPTSREMFLQNALSLSAFGTNREYNPILGKADEETRKNFEKRLTERVTADDGLSKVLNILRATVRYNFGYTQKDEVPKLIDEFLENLRSTNGWLARPCEHGIGGCFDDVTLEVFLLIRQALDAHTHFSMIERKLPGLRTATERILKVLPDMVRSDGLGWAYGADVGVYGQLYPMTLLVQCFRDGWIPTDKIALYGDLLCRLFQYFFGTFVDTERACLVVNDGERRTVLSQTTRSVTFDTIAFLCRWARWAGKIKETLVSSEETPKTKGRWVLFEKTYNKEQGLFLYRDAASGLTVQLPLIGNDGKADALAFPHCPGIFDTPVDMYLPVLLPELTISGTQTLPSFYGKNCVSGLGLKKAVTFSYEQPELISKDETLLSGIGSVKVRWSFEGSTVSASFIYKFKQPVTVERLRFVIPLSMPHGTHHLNTSPMLGENSLQVSVAKDDFGARWKEIESVTDNPAYRTPYGKICYLQTLERSTPLHVKPGKEYCLQLELKPDVRRFVGGEG
jgi:hypothetical protein